MPKLHLDHVAVALRSIKPALALYRDALGGEYLMGGDAGGTWRWIQLRFPGGGKVELLEPLGEGFLTRFLDRYGEGLHHITFKTDDIRAAIEELEAAATSWSTSISTTRIGRRPSCGLRRLTGR